jgi:hypothetical protein
MIEKLFLLAGLVIAVAKFSYDAGYNKGIVEAPVKEVVVETPTQSDTAEVYTENTCTL